MRREISWALLVWASILPFALALSTAWLFWRRGRTLYGNVAGLGLIFVACLVFGGAEYVNALRFRYECEAGALACLPSRPSDFVRLSMFAGLAMIQAMALFIVSAMVEKRQTEQGVESQWRRS